MTIRINSIVQYDTSGMSDRERNAIPTDFMDGTLVVYLGEIPNMRGHGIFATPTKTYIGYHICNFKEIAEYDI